MNLQGTRYDLNVKADAIELLVYYGYTIYEVAGIIGCTPKTVSTWYTDYLGYRGEDKEVIVMQSLV